MTSRRGWIVLMGSGELTPTMVDVHKQMLARQGSSPEAVFLDTPAGFQLNANEISIKAQEYFRQHVRHPLSIVSFKSADTASEYETQTIYQQLRNADYFLIGPGSPTYAVSHLQQTKIPEIITKRVESGACLTAASAAALTVGKHTLPVYEIYKVGQGLHWVDGLDILSRFGLNVVVIPHWNNAEGGTHDTRFCYMGEPRFEKLETLLPKDTVFVGLDEHTACIMDLETRTAEIRGLGNVIIRQGSRKLSFGKGDRVPLQLFTEGPSRVSLQPKSRTNPFDLKPIENKENSFWEKVHHLEIAFREGLAAGEAQKMITALLDLDSILWKAQGNMESENDITQTREILRDLIVLLGLELARQPKSPESIIEALISQLLEVRENCRKEKRWADADKIRDLLGRSNVMVEDTPDGQQWRMNHKP